MKNYDGSYSCSRSQNYGQRGSRIRSWSRKSIISAQQHSAKERVNIFGGLRILCNKRQHAVLELWKSTTRCASRAAAEGREKVWIFPLQTTTYPAQSLLLWLGLHGICYTGQNILLSDIPVLYCRKFIILNWLLLIGMQQVPEVLISRISSYSENR